MKILITGGAGFIGSHLADRLIEQGHEVLIIDDLSTGRRENINRGILFSFYFITDNILDQIAVSDYVRWADQVYHLAAEVGFFNVLKSPGEALRRNILGVQNIIDACVEYGKKLLFTSSSEIYGDASQFPQYEESVSRFHLPVNIRHCYSLSKLCGEYIIQTAIQRHELKAVIVRLFNTTGPRQLPDYGMVLPRFVMAALKGEPLVIHGSGYQRRTFCHVADTVEALDLLMNCDGATGRTFNIGADRLITIRCLAEKVFNITGSKSDIIYKKNEEIYGAGFRDQDYRLPRIDKIKDLVGWAPKRNLNQIIEDTVAYWRGRI